MSFLSLSLHEAAMRIATAKPRATQEDTVAQEPLT